MTKMAIAFLSMVLAVNAFAETRSLGRVIDKLTKAERNDLAKVISQLTIAPTKDPKTGKSVRRVTKVIEGSAWERAGFKVGDIVEDE